MSVGMNATVLLAFLHGVALGVLWECASMGVLVAATMVEYGCGTSAMTLLFVGLVLSCFAVASSAQLARPLLGILTFRLSAQLAMTIGTGSVLLVTLLHETPACTSSVLRASGWRAPLLLLLQKLLPMPLIRRIFGVQPPRAPPFLRLLAAVMSREWFKWVPTFGFQSIFALPGTISFRPSHGPPRDYDLTQATESRWFDLEELTGVYTYSCHDTQHSDFSYTFRYKAFWMRPAASDLLHTFGEAHARDAGYGQAWVLRSCRVDINICSVPAILTHLAQARC